ncbi:UbiD-domain-containing protein, partial [Aureobasidium melanogenum]
MTEPSLTLSLISAGGVLDRQKSITHNLSTLDGIERAMRVVRDQRESLDVVKEDLVVARAAACAECPHDIFEVVDVDVVAYQHQTVDRVADFVVENQVANTFGELLGLDLHFAELCGVDLEGHPGNLRLEVRHGVSNGQTGLLAELSDGGRSEGTDHGVLKYFRR